MMREQSDIVAVTFNVKQGQAVLFYNKKTGEAVLEDAGGDKESAEEIYKYMLDHNIKKFSLIISHWHKDHYFGAKFLAEKISGDPEKKISLENVYAPMPNNDYEAYSTLASLAICNIKTIPERDVSFWDKNNLNAFLSLANDTQKNKEKFSNFKIRFEKLGYPEGKIDEEITFLRENGKEAFLCKLFLEGTGDEKSAVFEKLKDTIGKELPKEQRGKEVYKYFSESFFNDLNNVATKLKKNYKIENPQNKNTTFLEYKNDEYGKLLKIKEFDWFEAFLLSLNPEKYKEVIKTTKNKVGSVNEVLKRGVDNSCIELVTTFSNRDNITIAGDKFDPMFFVEELIKEDPNFKEFFEARKKHNCYRNSASRFK